MSRQTLEGDWKNTAAVQSKRYSCGHCGSDITTQQGYLFADRQKDDGSARIYICHHCNKPTLFYDGVQIPNIQLGRAVKGLSEDTEAIYKEVRDSTSINAFSLAVLGARKLLMHIAVELGAEENKKFAEYVDYIVDNNYAPPRSKPWIDKIRSLGNDATHEIKVMSEKDARAVIKFVEMLLVFNYELPVEADVDVDGDDNE